MTDQQSRHPSPWGASAQTLRPVYQVKLRGQLRCEWSDWFDGMAIGLDENGDTLNLAEE